MAKVEMQALDGLFTEIAPLAEAIANLDTPSVVVASVRGDVVAALLLGTAELAELSIGMAELGYPANGGPEDVSIVGKTILALKGVLADRERLESAVAAEDERVTRLTADFEEVSRQRDALQKKLDRASRAKVTAAPKPPKLRAAGPMETPLAADDLLRRLQGGAHTLVFSDGEKEIDALDPVMVSGASSWRRRGRGVLLIEALRVKPNVTVELHGFAAFDAKGRQIGWAPLTAPLRLTAGQETKLDNQVLFAG